MAKKDYPELEGKLIEYLYKDGSKVSGRVALCNYDIGISITDPDDPTDHLVCLNGPHAPTEENYQRECYKKQFYFFIAQIKKGTIHVETTIKAYTKMQATIGNSGRMVSCPVGY